MRRPFRSWSNLLGKLGLQVVEKPSNASRSRHTQRQLSVESLERRDLMATLYWDTNGAAPGFGGAGTWNTTAANWTTDPTGSSATQAWNNAASDEAVFKGTGAAITLGTGIQVSSLKFESTGYTLSSGSLSVNGTGEIQVVSGSATISTPLTGSTELLKMGAGTLTLSGNNTISGGSKLAAGTLQVNHDSALGSGTITLDGGKLQAGNGARTLSNALFATAATTSELVSPLNNNLTLNGNLSGTGTVWKTGSGNVSLGGDNAAFAGTLSHRLGQVYLNTPASGSAQATWDITGGDAIAVNFAGEGTVQLGAISGSTGRFTAAQAFTGTKTFEVGALNSDTSVGGIVSNSGTGGTLVRLVKKGTGTLTLNGGNTYTGGTSIEAGTLQIGSGGTTGTLNTGSITNDGTLVFNRSNSLTLANNISGIGSLTKLGAGVLTLTGNNTYSGTTAIDGGTLQIGSGGTTGSLGSGAITNNGTLIFNRSDILGVANVISGTGSFTKLGTGALTLSGNNTFSGGSRLSAGTLQVDQDSALGTGVITLAGGKLQAGNGSRTLSNTLFSTAATTSDLIAPIVNDLTLTGNLTGTGTIRKTGAASVYLAGDNTAFAGAFSHRQGNLFLNSTNSGSALTAWDITGGDLLGLNFDGNGTIQFGSLAGTTGRLISNVLNGNKTIEIGSLTNSTSYAGTIQNHITTTTDTVVAVTKVGSGSLTLSGQNTFTGDLRISAGTINAARANNTVNPAQGALGNAQAARDVIVESGATLRFSASDTFGNGGSAPVTRLVVNGGTVTNNGAQFNALGAVVLNGGTLTGTGGASTNYQLYRFNGTITVSADSTISGTGTNSGIHLSSSSTAFDVASGVTLNISAKLLNQAPLSTVTATSLRKTGSGTMAITAGNTYSGGTTIETGTLQVGNGGTAGSLGSGEIAIQGNLAYNRSDNASVNNEISGTGTLSQNGSGTLIISGVPKEFQGTSVVNAGSLQVDANMTNPVTVNPGASLTGSGSTGEVTDAGGAVDIELYLVTIITTTPTAGSAGYTTTGSIGYFGGGSTPLLVRALSAADAVFKAVTGTTYVTNTNTTYNIPGPAFTWTENFVVNGSSKGPAITMEDKYGRSDNDKDYNDQYFKVSSERFTLTVDIDADSNNNGQITEADDENEADSAYSAPVALNDDFDNGTENIDHETVGVLTSENNLTKIVIQDIGTLPSGVTAEQILLYDDSKIAVYSDATRATLVPNGGEVTAGEYFVEGKAVGVTSITLQVNILDEEYTDEISIQVIKPSYSTFSNKKNVDGNSTGEGTTTSPNGYDMVENGSGRTTLAMSGPACECPTGTDPAACPCNYLPVLNLNVYLPVDEPKPILIEYRVTYDGKTEAGWTPITLTGIERGNEYVLPIRSTIKMTEDGHYEYHIDVRTTYSNLTVHDSRVSGYDDFVAPSQKGIGTGWFAGALDYLKVTVQGILHVRYDHSAAWYESDGMGGYETPDGSTGSITQDMDGGYTETQKSGNRQKFNADGQLVSRIAANGQTTSYEYTDADGDSVDEAISTITDAFGRTVQYDYTDGLLSSMTDIAGRVTTYARDSAGRITTVTDPDPDGAGPRAAPVTTYTYNSEDRVTSKTAPGDITTYYNYDNNGYLASITTGDATWLTEAADARQLSDPTLLTREAKYTDPNGNITLITVDDFGLTTKKVDAQGNVWLFERNSNGQVVKVTEPDPDGAGPLSGPETNYTYDAKGNLTRVDHPDASFETWTYDATFSRVTSHTDAAGRITTYSIDSATGDILSVTVGSGAETATTSFTYTDGTGTLPPGLLLTVTDALGRVTSYTYQASISAADFGRLIAVTFAVGTADEATTGFEYDLAGNVTATIDELGRRTEYEFNDLDQLTRMLLPDPDGTGTLTSPEIIYSYCSCGMQNKVTDALGNQTVHRTFDDHHRVVSMKLAEVGGIQPTYTYTYDDAGNRLTETDPLGQVTSYSYDELNRVILKTLPDPDGAGPLASPEWSFTYDTFGNLESSTDPLGLVTTYEYNSRQWLVAVTETAGSLVRETFYSYDASGLLSSITDALGRVTSFVYDTVGRLTTTTLPDPDGAGPLAAPVYSTIYDLVGNVLTETDALGNVTAYEYDARDRLVEITEADPDGAGSQTSPVTLFVYDDAGQLTSTIDALGRVTSYEYDNLGRLIKTTLADPDGLGGASAPEYTTTYDAMGNVLTETDALGNVTSYEYDALYRLTSATSADPDGAGPQTASVTSYDYDLLGQLTSMTDALGRVTSYTYDQLGRLISTTLPDPDGAGSLAAPVYSTTYDAVGNVLTETDSLGNVTTYEYDGFYRLITVTQADPDGAGALASPVSTFTYDLADQLLTTTDPLGRTTSYEYDNLGRVIFTTLPDPDGAGSLTSPIYETQYDAVGNVLAEIDALGQTTTYEYDNLYRLLTITEADPDGAGPQDSSITEYAYNAIGLVTAMIDPLGRTTTYAYDNLNRVTTTTLPDPDGAGPLAAPTYTNTYDAVGNVLSETDALGNTTSFAYDNLYRLITVTDQNGDDATYAYDKVGNLLNRSDAAGNTTSYVYDNLDRLTLETNQLSLTRTWAHDANGNLLSRTDRNGAETQYAYDALNRTITETWLAGVTVDNTIELTYLANGLLASITDDSSSYTYGYDGLDRLIGTSNVGTSGVVETIFSQQYDAVGRVTKVAASVDGVRDFQNDYAYDAQNRLTSLTQTAQTPDLGDPTPHAVAYKRVEFDYNADSQYAEIRRYASTGTSDLVAQTTYNYDATGRLTGMAHGQGVTELAGYRWTFDADNRVASFASLVDGTAFYTYDDRDQLTGEFYVDQYLDATGTFQAITGAGYAAAGQKNQAYQYDANGNRMRRTEVALPDRFDPSSLAYDPTTAWTPIGNSTTSESYTESGVTVTTTDDFNTDSASTNRLETDGTYDYSYDDQGNRSRRTHIANGTVTVYKWDSRNRLTQIVEYADANDADNEVDAIQTIAYRYDMFNRRIGKQVFDDTSTLVKNERFVWSGGNVALDFNDADLDGTAERTELSARYLWGQQVDQFFAQENIDDVLSDGETLWGLTDNLGTVRDLAAYDGGTGDTTIVDHRTYSAYGELTSGDATLSRYGFTAQEYDADAGMYYYDNRWYDQNVGQFISPDPIQDDPTNDYRYVLNDPANRVDPSGLVEYKVDNYASEFRKLLPELPKGDKADGWDVHHTKMKMFEKRYADSKDKINVHHPDNLRGVPKSIHTEISTLQREHLQKWADANNPAHLKGNLFGKGCEARRQYVIDNIPLAELDKLDAQIQEKYGKYLVPHTDAPKIKTIESEFDELKDAMKSAQKKGPKSAEVSKLLQDAADKKIERMNSVRKSMGMKLLTGALATLAFLESTTTVFAITNPSPAAQAALTDLTSQYRQCYSYVADNRDIPKNKRIQLHDSIINYLKAIGQDGPHVRRVMDEGFNLWIDNNVE